MAFPLRTLAGVTSLLVMGLPLGAGDIEGRVRLTLGAGATMTASGYKLATLGPGIALDGNARFLFNRFLGAEAGLIGVWPNDTCFTRYGSCVERTSFTMLPFDVVGVTPLGGGRLEIFAGFGGARVWETGVHDSYNPRNAMLMQITGGASFALDRGQRYRIDLRTRLLRDPGRPTQQWLVSTGGFTFAFGRR
jgi:hypothetical protein